MVSLLQYRDLFYSMSAWRCETDMIRFNLPIFTPKLSSTEENGTW